MTFGVLGGGRSDSVVLQPTNGQSAFPATAAWQPSSGGWRSMIGPAQPGSAGWAASQPWSSSNSRWREHYANQSQGMYLTIQQPRRPGIIGSIINYIFSGDAHGTAQPTYSWHRGQIPAGNTTNSGWNNLSFPYL